MPGCRVTRYLPAVVLEATRSYMAALTADRFEAMCGRFEAMWRYNGGFSGHTSAGVKLPYTPCVGTMDVPWALALPARL